MNFISFDWYCNVINSIKLLMILLLSVVVPMAYAGSACSGTGYKNDMSLTKSSPLRISVDLIGKKYKTTDDVGLMVTLWNESSMDFYILRKDGFYNDVSVKIKDHFTGRYLETNFAPTSLSPPPMSAKDLMKILQCNYVKEEIDISLRDFNLQVGHRYDLVVEYQSSLPKNMNFGVNIFDSERELLVSSPISIDIVGK